MAAFGELQSKLGNHAARETAADVLEQLQRESAEVNDLNGLVAFVVGALHEVMRSKSIEDAKTCAEMTLANINEYHAGLWRPGSHDDPADWRKR